MPPGAPYHSFLLPYRIRVDDFTTPRDQHFEPPALYLLSHTHSDHTTGLSARSFGARVVCSFDAKHMLLNSETARDRIAFDNGETSEKRKPYAHLKINHLFPSSSKRKTFSRDLLRALPLNSPTVIELSDDVTVTLTLLDANHCPGAVMFLVEGPLGNFLHTGDLRAESPFLESLARNPWLQRYISPSATFIDSPNGSGEKAIRILDAIHLDTACLLSHHDLPSKHEACSGLVELMSLFPPLTRFFINSWTWGYEDILKAIGRAFNTKVHVDRYKFDIYSGISDPFLKSLITLDAPSTRFHACERKSRCEQVEHRSAGVVYVNPVSLSKVKWDNYFHETRGSLQRGENVPGLICPLSRHSSLPELQAFVKIFKPKIVVPNFLNPSLGHLDWACMPRMFSDCLADGGEAAMRASMRSETIYLDCLDYVAPRDDTDSNEIGTEMDNLVGEGAEDLARQWIGESREDTGHGTTTEECRLVTQIGKFLGLHGQQLLTIQLNGMALRKRQSPDSTDSEGEVEVRERTKDIFFAPTSQQIAVSTLHNMRHRSSSLISPSRSRRLAAHLLTPNPRASSQKSSHHVWRDSSPSLSSVDSPLYSKVSQMTATSPSPPFFNSLHPSDERAYHSLFDALQFNKRLTPSASNLPTDMGHVVSPPHTTAFPSHSENGVLESPCVTFSSPELKEVPCFADIPLPSPSVTPSPLRPPLRHTPIHDRKGQAPPAPASRSNAMPLRDRRSQPPDEVMRPPMLDLKKMLKRSSSEGGPSRSATKRRITLSNSNVHAAVNSSSAAKANLVSRCTSLEGLDVRPGQEPSSGPVSTHTPVLAKSSKNVPGDPPPVIVPSSWSAAEKERRFKAKAIQVQIRAKLVRALPSKNVTPTCVAKVERWMQALAELRARNKTSIIARKQSVYGLCEVPSHPSESWPSRHPDPSKHQDTISDFRQAQTVIFDESTMDWDKSRRYQEGLKTQRQEGIRYPQLPRLERSFAESQSP